MMDFLANMFLANHGQKDRMEFASCILELATRQTCHWCCQSDKDGEVIRIGDTVYGGDGDEHKFPHKHTNIFLVSKWFRTAYATVCALFNLQKASAYVKLLADVL